VHSVLSDDAKRKDYDKTVRVGMRWQQRRGLTALEAVAVY